MPSWTPEQLRDYENRHIPSRAVPEPAVCDEPVAAEKGKAENPTRRLVSIKSFRCQLLDPDNPCPKYFIDALRYAGAILNDRDQDITLQVSQVKVPNRKQERTEIEITP